ncbi:MAG: exo-alpha-sialidase, partial [Clostridia bacterium]|nr:exo-alpha-sialidase [Clostridia bacterium]
WSEAGTACEREGRIYDAKTYGSHSQFLIHRNDDFIGSKPEHDFALYEWSASENAFYLKSTLPGNSIGKGYCCMEYGPDGTLYAFTYDSLDEYHMPRFVSTDFGKTWEDGGSVYLDKMIRNPQLVYTKGGWFLHGRNGDKGDGLVIYHSDDGFNWDKGEMIITRPGPGVGYYSNNIYLPEANRVLIQFSHVYDLNRVNIMHMTIEGA